MQAGIAREESALLIDDDVELCSMLQDYLGRHGWHITVRHSGGSGLREALEARYDAVLLDVMLPDLDGFEVLRQLRTQSSVGVLLLTARGEDVDRIVGLELGADDYLPKPFNPRELLARMRALSRRSSWEHKPVSQTFSVAGFTIDSNVRKIQYSSQTLELTDLEYLLLRKLLEKPFEIVPRELLVEQILERPFRPLDRSIDMHMSRIRKKLENLRGFSGGIRTVRSSGYMFVPKQESA